MFRSRLFSTSPVDRLATQTGDSSGPKRLLRQKAWLSVTVCLGLVSTALLGVVAGDTAANAAARTTTKKPAKVKTTTTKRRKPPAPAKAAKRAGELWQPNSTAPFAPLNFDPRPKSSDPNNPSAPDAADAYKQVEPSGGVFTLLIVGTDARPGERAERTRADSIHLFTYNPSLKKGTLVGFPRDSYVKAPNGEQRKINEVMSTAGPDAFLATVNQLSGLGTKRYILTGFEGFKNMVDGVGGVKVLVQPQMNDAASGAQFAEGWFQFNGNAALAFARARKTLPRGDFERSANQAKLLKFGFDRLQESTDNIRALLNWVLVIRKNSVSNIKPNEWMYLAQVARGISNASITSVVVDGADDMVDGQSVIRLDDAKLRALMKDLADGVVGT